jgi:hypothetical protein
LKCADCFGITMLLGLKGRVGRWRGIVEQSFSFSLPQNRT